MQMAEEEDHKTVKESAWDKFLRQDQERNIQIQLRNNALAGQQLLQMKEKALQKAREKRQSKRDLEMLQNLDELLAQELRRQEEQKPVLMEIKRKNCLEDISRRKSYRGEQEEILRTENEQTKLACVEMEGKLLQREAEAVKFTSPRLFSKTVSENLVSLKKEQAAATAERDEQSFFNGLAKRRAGLEKQQKEKAEENAEALQSISAHRQKMIQEREQREEAERQSNVAWLQAQIDADRSFQEKSQLKAQRTRKERVQLQNFSDSLEAEKLTGEDRGTARHTLGGELCFSCDEGSSYIAADTEATPLIHYGRANEKQQWDCKRLGKITSTIPDIHAIPAKNKAVDINHTNKQLDTATVLTQGHKDMVQLCPTPPPAELRTDSERSSWVRKLISGLEDVSVKHSLEKSHLDRESQVMVEEEEDRKTVKEGQSIWDKVLRQDQERNIQIQLRNNALAGQQLLQMKEKALQKAQEKRQSKRDLEMLQNLDELHAQELRRQEEQKPVLKEIKRKNCLEDISRRNSYRGKQEEILRTENEQTKLACVEMEGKLLQREAEATVRFTRHRLFSKTVSENLASLKKEQAAATAEREEQSFFNGLAKRQAGLEKQQKEKAEKNAEALQSISAHRQKMIQEREQREEAERQSNVAWLQAQKDADRSFLEEIKLKAQRTRKERVQLQNFSDSLEAEKLTEDRGTARHTLGGELCFSCDEGSSYIAADTEATPLIHYGRANEKQQWDCKRLGKITSTIPDIHAISAKNKAVDINHTNKQLDTAKVLTQGHKDMVQLCPTPPPAELRTDSERSNRVRKLISRLEDVSVNHSLERSHLDRENQVMVEEEEDRKTMKEGQSIWDKVLRQDQERNIQIQLRNNALAGQQLLQMKEKALQKAQEKRQSKRDFEMLQNLDELLAQELRRQKEQKPVLKEIKRKNCLEDISGRNSYRGKQEEILRTEKEQTKLACVEMEGKLLQREAEATVRFTTPRLFSKTVSENLASLKKEQAAATAEREEQSFFNGLAKRRAAQDKQQKEKAEKNAEALQSISAHRQKMIQEREQREEAERQSNVARLQAQIEADRSFLEEIKLKAQRTRKERVQLQNLSDSLEAEKLTGEDRGTARHTLGGELCFSCDEGSSYIAADTEATPLIHYGRANEKQQWDCKRLGKITSTIPDIHAIPAKNKAVDINDTNKQLDTATVLTQGHKDMVQLCPTPPPAELRTDSERSNRVRKLISRLEDVSVNHSLERSHLDRESQVMVEEEEDHKTVKEGQSIWDTFLRQDQERNIQIQLRNNALAGQQLLQMKEKALQKAREKQQSKRDFEMLQNLDELLAQELRLQEEQKPVLKEIKRKNCLEDISRRNSYRGKQEEILRTENEQTKLACVEMEGKLLQREAEATVRFTTPRLFSKTVSENLASLKKEQAAATAEREEQSFFNGLAKRQAGLEKQQKEKAEKNAEALQSISAHRQKMIQEREQREEAERQSNVARLQAQKDADRSFLDENKLKASLVYLKTQRTRKTLTEKDRGAATHTIGGGVSFGCNEGSNYITSDTAGTPLIQYGRKQQLELKHEDLTKIGQISLSSAFTKLPSIQNKHRQSKSI